MNASAVIVVGVRYPVFEAVTFTVALPSLRPIESLDTVSIAANSIAAFDIKQVLVATDTIQGGASNTAVTFHISGVEIV